MTHQYSDDSPKIELTHRLSQSWWARSWGGCISRATCINAYCFRRGISAVWFEQLQHSIESERLGIIGHNRTHHPRTSTIIGGRQWKVKSLNSLGLQRKSLERVTGIEPAYPAWKADRSETTAQMFSLIR